MTEPHDSAPIQEPGIGGPVDLAGIERYRKIRALVVSLLAVAMFATVVAHALSGLDWPEESFMRGGPSVSTLAMQAFLCALLALMSANSGNRTETRLACLGALWAAVIGIMATLGCAALLALWAPAWPAAPRVVASLFAGYAAVAPLTISWALFTHGRHRRLVARTKEARA